MGTSPLTALVEVVREVTGADRVEAELTGQVATVSGSAAAGSRPEVFEVVDEEGPLAELRVYGARAARLRDVVPEAAALLAVAAGREHRPQQERVWVGRLGHDLKSPLTAVLGFAGLLGSGGVAAAPPELVQAARAVTETGERLLAELEDDLEQWRR